MKLISVDKLTAEELAKLAAASRKARPTARQRAEFAAVRRSWQALKALRGSLMAVEVRPLR